MNDNAVAVFGALRAADEHELEPWQIAKRAKVHSRPAIAALRDLRKLGIVSRRYDGPRVLYGLANRAARR